MFSDDLYNLLYCLYIYIYIYDFRIICRQRVTVEFVAIIRTGSGGGFQVE